jgi:4-hydroxy-tetrahydrodipicolinate synthase
MDRNDVDWKGYWPASPTPFTESGELDETSLRELLRFYHREGMHGVLINGTSGEWFSQSEEERRRVAEIAVEELGGKIPVVIGCTTFNAGHTAELGRHARSIGADGFLCTPPPYSQPSADEIVAFYETVGRAVDLPLMVYNWPPGTNVDISTEVAVRLCDVPNIVAIKESTKTEAQFYRTLAAVVDRVRVFGNFMNPVGVAALRQLGGDGFVGGGTIFGAPDAEFWNALWRGDYAFCEAHAERVAKLTRQIWNSDWTGKFGGGQSQVKAIMAMLGQPGGHPRPPRLPITDPATLDGLRAVLASVGLPARERVGSPS